MKDVAELDSKLLHMISEGSLKAGTKSAKKISGITTAFSVSKADSLFYQWKNLDKYLMVKYIDGNTKKQNPDGSFMNNGHSKTIPPQPEFPGYTEAWKKAVKESAGERLTL